MREKAPWMVDPVALCGGDRGFYCYIHAVNLLLGALHARLTPGASIELSPQSLLVDMTDVARERAVTMQLYDAHGKPTGMLKTSPDPAHFMVVQGDAAKAAKAEKTHATEAVTLSTGRPTDVLQIFVDHLGDTAEGRQLRDAMKSRIRVVELPMFPPPHLTDLGPWLELNNDTTVAVCLITSTHIVTLVKHAGKLVTSDGHREEFLTWKTHANWAVRHYPAPQRLVAFVESNSGAP